MPLVSRRTALTMLAGATAAFPPNAFAQDRPRSAREVFAEIKRASGQAWDPNPTDDRIIFGDPATPITGIATCFFSSMAVLRAAKDAGLNYIIPHEASFYERYDDFAESVLPDSDPVMSAKKRFVTENGMVIQRMHGHAHSMPGDAINTGLLAQLDWTRYRIEGPRAMVKIPTASAMEVGRYVKQRCGRRTLRMFGDPAQMISTISLSSGMPGENAQIAQMETPGVEAVFLGEVREPEVLGYAQDLAASRKMVVYLVGHTSEDFGMRIVSEWTQKVFPNLPSRWFPTVDPYTNPA
jgi:putative NIF3 family GTP cyclohydrolase 1 type 2